jgi:hypothetical protein
VACLPPGERAKGLEAEPAVEVIKEELAMAGRSYSEDLSSEMAGKAVMWGPAIAGAVLLGPVGLVLGLAAAVAVVASGGSSKSPVPDGEQPEE